MFFVKKLFLNCLINRSEVSLSFFIDVLFNISNIQLRLVSKLYIFSPTILKDGYPFLKM